MPDEGEQGGGIGETFTVLAKTYAYAPTLPLPLFFSFFLSFNPVQSRRLLFPFSFARAIGRKKFSSPRGWKEREREREWTDEKLLRDSRSETRAAEHERARKRGRRRRKRRKGEEKSFLPGWRKG